MRHISPKWIPTLALATLTWLAYSNSFDLGFALDTRGIVQGDPRIRAVNTENLGLILRTDYWWPSSVDRLYRPLVTASFLFNYAVLGNGQNAYGYHCFNFLLHLVNVLLVFYLTRRILQSDLQAVLATAVWAVHPVGTEAVTNVVGRSDLLAALSVLGGLLTFDRLRTQSGRRLWMWCGGCS